MFGYNAEIRIVERNGKSQLHTWACLGHHYPLAAAAAPDDSAIVWLVENDLMVWRRESQQFVSDESFSLSSWLENRSDQDAVMGTDGVLLILLQDGTSLRYRCATDEILQ